MLTGLMGQRISLEPALFNKRKNCCGKAAVVEKDQLTRSVNGTLPKVEEVLTAWLSLQLSPKCYSL